MELRANITKNAENLFSSRSAIKNSNNNNNNNIISTSREPTLNSIKSVATTTTKKSFKPSVEINEFNELPKHIIDEKRLKNFQTEMHRKIIGLFFFFF